MEEYKSIKKRINGVLGLYTAVKLIFLLSSLFLGLALQLLLSLFFEGKDIPSVYEQFADTATLPGLLLSVILTLFAIGVPLCLYLFLSRQKLSQVCRFRRPTILQVGYGVSAAYFVGLISALVSTVFFTVLFSLFGMSDTWETMQEASSSAPTNFWLVPLFLILLAVLPGLLEETLMRGVGLSAAAKLGNGFAILFCGFFFGLMHNTWIQTPFAMALGCVLAWMTIKFDSIWVAVLAHFFYNLNSAVIQLLMTNVPEQTGNVAVVIYFIFWSGLMAAFLITGIIIYGVKLPKAENLPKIPWPQKLKTLFLSPFFYLFLLFSAAVLVLQLVLY